MASHALDAFPDNGQADAGTGILLRTMEALENPENALLMFAGDADSVVLNPEADGVGVFFGPNPNAGSDPGFDELESIGNQIDQNLDQDAFLRPDFGQRSIDVDLGLLFPDIRFALFERLVERGFHLDSAHVDFVAAEAAIVQQVLDQRVHSFGGGGDSLGEAPAVGVQ